MLVFSWNSKLKAILRFSILLSCNIVMYHQTLYLSSLIFAALASTKPTPATMPTSASPIHPRAATPTSFKIQYQNIDDSPALNGFAYLIPGSTSDSAQTQGYTDDAASAATFTLNADASLSVGDLFSNMLPQAVYTNVKFQTEEIIASQGDYKTSCTLGDGSILSCSTNTGNYDNDVYYTYNGTTGYGIEAGPTGRPYDGSYTVRLLAVSL